MVRAARSSGTHSTEKFFKNSPHNFLIFWGPGDRRAGSRKTPKKIEKGVSCVALTPKEKKIKKETKRLLKVFEGLEPNKLQTVAALIDRAAYITVSLQELEEELNTYGWTEEYFNGRNQSGIKKSAAAEVHISLTKNLNAIMKQLLDLVPPAQKESRLTALIDE